MARKRANGECRSCSRPAATGFTMCSDCLARARARAEQAKAERALAVQEPCVPTDPVPERFCVLMMSARSKGMTFTEAWPLCFWAALSHAPPRERPGWERALRATIPFWLDGWYGRGRPQHMAKDLLTPAEQERRPYTLCA